MAIMNMGIVNEPKVTDNLNIGLVNIENGSSIPENTIKHEIYEDILRPLLYSKTCIDAHKDELDKIKRSGFSMGEINRDILDTLESTLIKVLDGIQKHLCLRNIGDKYKNHTFYLKRLAQKLGDDIKNTDDGHIWNGTKNISMMVEPIVKLVDMLKYDFGFL